MVEYDSLACGLKSLDALVKQAPVEVLESNLIEPGRFLILFAGGVAEVEESFTAATAPAEQVIDSMLLPHVHPDVLSGLRGNVVMRDADQMDTIGVVEGVSVASSLRACDRSLKDADVTLAGLRVCGGLGGRAYYVVFGAQHDVEAAIEVGEEMLGDRLHRSECIARPHPEMVVWLLRPPSFAVR